MPFNLAEGADSGHGLHAGNLTEGHRFHAPGAFAVTSFAEWEAGLRARHVIPAAGERRRADRRRGRPRSPPPRSLSVVPDEGLLDEVAGLVEWPVPLLGRIDAAYMDLPAEVMQVSMRVNQRYFALRTRGRRRRAALRLRRQYRGRAMAAPPSSPATSACFAPGSATPGISGTWTAAPGSPTASPRWTASPSTPSSAPRATRVRRLVRLAGHIAPLVGADRGARPARAALLAKADLTTGMVGEFPELQGVMGGYYAAP